VDLRPVSHVVVYTFRKRVRLLEHHPDLGAELHRIDAGVVDILAFQQDLPGDTSAGDGVVHPVQTAQEGGFPAARRPDEGGHGAVKDVDIDILQRVVLAVMHLHAPRGDLGALHRNPRTRRLHTIHSPAPHLPHSIALGRSGEAYATDL
jgi:hypothetical protein